MNQQTPTDVQIIELLASRICHDLISPVGAVNNGVELMQEMGPDAGDEAIQLIAYSASQAAAKLQAFRLAYGAGGRDSNIKLEDVHRIFGDLIGKEGRLSQSWDPSNRLGYDDLPPGFCKILLGALMLAAETMPRGGKIGVAPDAGHDTPSTESVAAPSRGIIVAAEGQDAALRANMDKAIARTLPADLLDPRLIHAYLLPMIAAQYGFAVSAHQAAENKLHIHIKLVSGQT